MNSSLPLRPLSFAALVAGGFLSSLWALFQWGELLVARAGGTPFCAIGGSFDCAAVWDSGFARAVHDVTRVPVAGWGLMWGIVAFTLPLLALVNPAQRGLSPGLRLTALAGLASVGGLAVASFMAGAICIGCIGTYILVAGWSVGAWLTTKETGFTEPQRGVFLAGALTLAAYLVLLVPGMRTPHALAEIGKEAIAKSVGASGPVKATAGTPGPFDGPSTGDPAKDAALQGLLEQLPAEAKQSMSDLLGAYESADTSTNLPIARTVHGDGAIRVIDWTDPLCPHCRELHEVLDEIIKVAPGSISVESHFFPLDGLCNSSVERKTEMGEVRCLATKALMCLEGDPEKFHLGQKLIFDNQRDLTVEKVWRLLGGMADRKTLETCMASPELLRNLNDDIASATANHLEGTPLVLLNGKEVQPFGPILYALALTGGKTKTLAFKTLPPPKPLLPQSHAGHKH